MTVCWFVAVLVGQQGQVTRPAHLLSKPGQSPVHTACIRSVAVRACGRSRDYERGLRTARRCLVGTPLDTPAPCTPFVPCVLQYLVVCVPNAFASSLETWFGRIVDSRAGGSSAGSSTQQGGAAAAAAPGWSAAGLPGPGGSGAASGDRRAESSWDSGMYMKRLGQVLDTLQVSVACQVGCVVEALMSCCRGSVFFPQA